MFPCRAKHAERKKAARTRKFAYAQTGIESPTRTRSAGTFGSSYGLFLQKIIFAEFMGINAKRKADTWEIIVMHLVEWPRAKALAMDALSRGPFSTCTAATAPIFGSRGLSCSSYEPLLQRFWPKTGRSTS